LKRLFLTIILVVDFLLTGCGEKVDDLTLNEKSEGTYQNNTSTVKSNGNTVSNQEKELILNIEHPTLEPIHIDIKEQLPLLTLYLEQFDEPQNELNRIRSNYLFSNNQRDYFLISYSCGTKLCNQILLENYQGDIQTLMVSEASFYQDLKHSKDYLTLLFGKNEGSRVVRNQVVTFNLDDFRKITPPDDLSKLESFEFPITGIEWEDDTY